MNRKAIIVEFAAGFLVFLDGIIPLAGYTFHNPYVTRMTGNVEVVPMAPTTAFGLAICGALFMWNALQRNGYRYEPPSTGGRIEG